MQHRALFRVLTVTVWLTGVLSSALVRADTSRDPARLGVSSAPLGLGMLRPEVRPGLERQLGVRSLDELTRYEIDQALDDTTGSFQGRATVRWTNTTGAPVDTLPLLLHPNAPSELGASPSRAITIDQVSSVAGPALTWSQPRPTLVNLRFAPPIAPGSPVSFAVRWTGRLRPVNAQANDMFTQAFQSMSAMASRASSDYGLLGIGDGLATMASAYPMVAPPRAGGFDTLVPGSLGDLAYNVVASFRVRTVVPAGFTVVTNLVDRAPEPAPSGAPAGSQLVVSEGALVRDFVLVGGRDLERASRMVGPVRVTSTYRKRDGEAGRAVLDAAASSLTSFERRFGPYPYTELDLVEATLEGGAGGVEFGALALIAGMLYRDPLSGSGPLALLAQLGPMLGGAGISGPGGLGAGEGSGLGSLEALLGGGEGASRPLKPGESSKTEARSGHSPARPRPPANPASPSRRAAPGGAQPSPAAGLAQGMLGSMRDFTVAHEVAHQYFAGLVGNDSRRAALIDEPLAQFAAALAMEDRKGEAFGREALEQNAKLGYAMYRLLGGADRPVARDLSAFHSSAEYAGLVYGKAPYLYVALRRSLGDARLMAALRSAVTSFRFRLVDREAWFRALEAAAGGSSSGVRAAERRWLDEVHGDADLGVDDSGDALVAAMFPGELGASMKLMLGQLGMKPRDLLRLLLGGASLDGSPSGPGLDPADALRALEGR